MIVTFSNELPPDTQITKAAAAKFVGQVVPITMKGEHIGFAEITKVVVTKKKITFTYTTEAPMGLTLHLSTPEDKEDA